MIKLEHLHVEEFRGIRSIDLPLNSKSFVVYGPNGSGKSGVVDAIDFALTGEVERLKGSGTGGISLLQHGPHVDCRDNPTLSLVALTVKDVDSGETSVLTRRVKDANTFDLDPENQSIRNAILEAEIHPELTLSRREIIKYIITKPGDRAKQVQSLLKLDRLDEFRALLKSVQNKAESKYKSAKSDNDSAEKALISHLNIQNLTVEEIKKEINGRRSTIGLTDIDRITPEVDLAIGISSESQRSSFNLIAAKRDVEALQSALEETSALEALQDKLVSAITTIENDSTLLDSLRHQDLLDLGIERISDSHCPLCDYDWGSIEALRTHLGEKAKRSEKAQEVKKGLLNAGQNYKEGLKTQRDKVASVVPVAKSHGQAGLNHKLTSYSDSLLTHREGVGYDAASIIQSKSSLIASVYTVEDATKNQINNLLDTLRKEPDQTAIVDAKTFLKIAQDHWEKLKLRSAQRREAERVRNLAKIAYEEYCTISNKALEDLYQSVEADFSHYYQRINSDDEGDFVAKLTPKNGSLDLLVDFYDYGQFPPTAYHSEGHQDGMGICLYLALVKQILGNKFKYAVLDDVVMSVDVNHKQRFCKLLKDEFPDVQFIITTHDEVWARQMQSAGLVGSKNQARFYGWTVTGGPLYEEGDIWERIDDDLAKGDVSGAAHKLRRRLEAAASDLAGSLGASVVYRTDNNYDPSALLNAVKKRHNDLLKKASRVANKWNDEEAKAVVKEKKEARAKIIPEQDSESWIINKLVHNNDWVNASVNDFKPVLESTKAFFSLFECDNDNCTGWIYVSGRPEDSLRCRCGRYNLNIKE